MRKVCSKCHQGIMKCQCENYHPPVLSGIDMNLARKLVEHYDSIGWISYEEWPEIHNFIRELNLLLREN